MTSPQIEKKMYYMKGKLGIWTFYKSLGGIQWNKVNKIKVFMIL